MVRGLSIVTSHTNYDVTSCPVVMRRYASADWIEQRSKTSKTQVFLAFDKKGERGRIYIDHLYGLCCRGWYCYPAQHSLCRPARLQPAVRRWLVQLSNTALVVPTGAAASGGATAGTTRAVPDSSTNHSGTNRIVVNSYYELVWPTLWRRLNMVS